MNKQSRQEIVDLLVEMIRIGKPRMDALALVVEKWQVSSRTFDRYWKAACEQLEDVSRAAWEAANTAYIESMADAAKDAFMSEAEVKRLTTEIARSNLADYIIVRKIEHHPRI